jgi:hypothetical protein
MTDIFERLDAKRQLKEQPSEPDIVRRGPQPLIPLAHRKSSQSEQLLSWLINFWPRPFITLRDISAFGPRCVRDPMDATKLTQTLSEFGWLIPVEAWRRDQKKWRVIREPSKQAPTQV